MVVTIRIDISSTVTLVYSKTLGATKMCCYNQVVVITRTFSTETIETVPNMCVCKEVDVVNSDFLTEFDCISIGGNRTRCTYYP